MNIIGKNTVNKPYKIGKTGQNQLPSNLTSTPSDEDFNPFKVYFQITL